VASIEVSTCSQAIEGRTDLTVEFAADPKQPALDQTRQSEQDADTGNRGPFAKEWCGIIEQPQMGECGQGCAVKRIPPGWPAGCCDVCLRFAGGRSTKRTAFPMHDRCRPVIAPVSLIQSDNRKLEEVDAVCKQLKRNDIDCMTIRN
jgi:hypothetical protein